MYQLLELVNFVNFHLQPTLTVGVRLSHPATQFSWQTIICNQLA